MNASLALHLGVKGEAVRDVEVDELYLEIDTRHHDVVWLDVAVDNAPSVEKINGGQELLGDLAHLFDRNITCIVLHVLLQGQVPGSLKHEIRLAFGLVAIEHFDDERVGR